MNFIKREDVEPLASNSSIQEINLILTSIEPRISKAKLKIGKIALSIYHLRKEQDKTLAELSDLEYAETMFLVNLQAKQRGVIP